MPTRPYDFRASQTQQHLDKEVRRAYLNVDLSSNRYEGDKGELDSAFDGTPLEDAPVLHVVDDGRDTVLALLRVAHTGGVAVAHMVGGRWRAYDVLGTFKL